MRIYFCASITGGREHADFYGKLVAALKRHGEVLTEHLGEADLTTEGEALAAKDIHDRDLAWLARADAVVADVTVHSLGVGYEIRTAVDLGKPVLALCHENGKRASGMIEGSDAVQLTRYKDEQAAVAAIDAFFTELTVGGKLVRDNIPSIIEADGKAAVTRTVRGDEYVRLARQKLLEEVKEYLADPTPEELVDIAEVVRALAETHDLTPEELDILREAKAKQRGGFSAGIVLDRIEEKQ